MTIFRGEGGGGDATSDVEVNLLSTLSNTATAAATSATASANTATAAAATATTQAGAASVSASDAAASAALAQALAGTAPSQTGNAGKYLTTNGSSTSWGALSSVAVSGAYSDLTGTPTLGTAAATNSTAYATAAQGTLADSALQPAAIGVSVQAYNANNAVLNATQSFTQAQRGAVVALTDGATITPNFATGNNFSVTLAGNRTLASPTNLTAGQHGSITITQDATGSRTLAYGSSWKFSGGTAPSLTTTANAVDVLAYYVESGTRITAKLITDVK
jgi:hypothetical protein